MYEAFKKYFFSIVPVTEEEWREQEKELTVQQIPKNEFLLREGQIERGVHFVNQGSFRVYNLLKGKELTTNFFFTGSVATDYSSLIKQEPSLEYIQALEDTEVITVKYAVMQDLYERFPRYQKFGRLIAERTFTAVYARQQELLMSSPKERYLNLMEKRPKVLERIPQIYIASYLGITPEYLSRIRREIIS